MSKKYRKESEANLYHVVARGIAQQILFEDDNDRQYFGSCMRRYLCDYRVELYAWCFMSNHVHLLLHARKEVMAKFMRQLLSTYARYFNGRHGRSGHVFEGRYDSVAIEDEPQLLTAIRYIHRNPLSIPKQDIYTYTWSSYREYLDTPFITTTDEVMNLFASKDDFVRFHEEWAEASPTPQKTTTASRRMLIDDEAVVYAQQLLGVDSVTDIAALPKSMRDKCLACLKQNGFSISQIARLTGIGRNIVQRAK